MLDVKHSSRVQAVGEHWTSRKYGKQPNRDVEKAGSSLDLYLGSPTLPCNGEYIEARWLPGMAKPAVRDHNSSAIDVYDSRGVGSTEVSSSSPLAALVNRIRAHGSPQKNPLSSTSPTSKGLELPDVLVGGKGSRSLRTSAVCMPAPKETEITKRESFKTQQGQTSPVQSPTHRNEANVTGSGRRDGEDRSTMDQSVCEKCSTLTSWRLKMPCGRSVLLCPACSTAFLALYDERVVQPEQAKYRAKKSQSCTSQTLDFNPRDALPRSESFKAERARRTQAHARGLDQSSQQQRKQKQQTPRRRPTLGAGSYAPPSMATGGVGAALQMGSVTDRFPQIRSHLQGV